MSVSFSQVFPFIIKHFGLCGRCFFTFSNDEDITLILFSRLFGNIKSLVTLVGTSGGGNSERELSIALEFDCI